jgi:hypothetical protein
MEFLGVGSRLALNGVRTGALESWNLLSVGCVQTGTSAVWTVSTECNSTAFNTRARTLRDLKVKMSDFSSFFLKLLTFSLISLRVLIENPSSTNIQAS